MCDEKFIDEVLSAEGDGFTESYHAAKEGGYFENHESELKSDLPSTNHTENLWEN